MENINISKTSEIVTENNTALSVGSGSLKVYATPSMIALMEKAACLAVSSLLHEGETTVGTMMNVNHISATPVGMEVYATAEVISHEGRKFVLKVEAFDECGKIGEGMHERFLVFSEKFTEKTYSKLK